MNVDELVAIDVHVHADKSVRDPVDKEKAKQQKMFFFDAYTY